MKSHKSRIPTTVPYLKTFLTDLWKSSGHSGVRTLDPGQLCPVCQVLCIQNITKIVAYDVVISTNNQVYEIRDTLGLLPAVTKIGEFINVIWFFEATIVSCRLLREYFSFGFWRDWATGGASRCKKTLLQSTPKVLFWGNRHKKAGEIAGLWVCACVCACVCVCAF